MAIKHKKTANVNDWTQAQLDSIIAGNPAPLPPPGTVLNDVVLPKHDWNDDHTITGDVDFGGFKATDLSDPLGAQDAATKNYVDSHSVGTLNGLSGVINLTSTGSTVTITEVGNDINLESSGGTNYWAASDDDIHNNNIGGVGIGQSAPTAQLHITPLVTLPTNFNSGITIGVTTGFSFGTGDRAFALYGENSSVPIFTPVVNGGFTEPPSTDYNPQAPTSVAFDFSGTGYQASGYDFDYLVWALYGGSTQISLGNADTGSTGTDPSDGSFYNVNASWTAPVGTAPDAYLVQCTGSNPNSGLYQVIGFGSGPSFVDNGGGWTSSASYGTLLYDINLTWVAAPSLIDNYVVVDASTGQGIIADNVTSAVCDGTWGAAPPTNPNGKVNGFQNDGNYTQVDPFFSINGVGYNWPATQQSGVFQSDGATPANIAISPLQASSLLATTGQILFGQAGFVIQSSKLSYDDTSLKLGSTGNSTVDFGIFRFSDGASSGTLNNYGTQGISNLVFAFPVTITGFAQGFNGKFLIVNNTNGVTYKNNSGSSSSGNKIVTPNGGDYTPTTTYSIWLYNGSSDFWEAWSPDFTQVANTWAKNQTYADGVNEVYGTTIGTKHGTAINQKQGFFNATPIVQPTGSIKTALTNLGLVGSPTIPASDISSGAALTKTDDTNVTMTLGGTPSTALLTAASMALGWTGTLSVARGGTGAGTLVGAGIPSVITNVQSANQSADISSTNFVGANVAGLYRVHYSLEDTTADVTAGAVTLTIAYTAAAGAITVPSAALVLTGVGLTQGTIFVQLSSGSISYSTTHTGLFGTAKYALYMTVERLI